MKNYNTILLFSNDLSKICWNKLDLLQDIRKFYGELFEVHVFLNSARCHQRVAFNPLATQCLIKRDTSTRIMVFHLALDVWLVKCFAWVEVVFHNFSPYKFV